MYKRQVEEVHPAIVVVDSFRTVAHASESQAQLQEFVQRLSLYLTGWQATTFLVGEYETVESHSNPVFTIADGIIWLTQSIERNSCVRRMQVTKMRACATMPGLHTLLISSDGVRVFPRILPRTEPRPRAPEAARASTGVEALDAMMFGGIPAGASALFVGPSGSGKSLFSRHFIAAGAEAGEPGIIVVFEEHPGEYRARASAFGPELSSFIERGLVEILYLRSLDLTVDIVQSFTELGLSPHITEFLADVLVLQRYIELEGKLEKVLAVVKMRTSRHDRSIRRYTIESSGVVVGEPVRGYGGVLTGVPIVRADGPASLSGLTRDEAALLHHIRLLGEADARALSLKTGLKGSAMSLALERLRHLKSVITLRRKGITLYRAKASEE